VASLTLSFGMLIDSPLRRVGTWEVRLLLRQASGHLPFGLIQRRREKRRKP
jgi:hypothetical protein